MLLEHIHVLALPLIQPSDITISPDFFGWFNNVALLMLADELVILNLETI